MTADRRAYAGGRFALELDDKKTAGFVNSIDGGHFKAENIGSQVGVDSYVTRFPGKPKYEDISFTVGTAMSPMFWQWVQKSLDHEPQRRNGALVGYDFDSKEKSRRTFYDALISEVGFPGLDASARSIAVLTVKLAPERLEYKKGDGGSLNNPQALNESPKQKLWLTNNFRFELENMHGDPSLRNVSKIEAFTVKQNVINNPIGRELVTRKEVGRLELPQLQVSIPESMSAKWMQWYDTAIAKGDHLDQYTTGRLTYLAADTTTELMHLDFSGISIVGLEIEKYEAHKEGIAKVKATLNIETLTLATGSGTA